MTKNQVTGKRKRRNEDIWQFMTLMFSPGNTEN
jgi:hypothetical protein